MASTSPWTGADTAQSIESDDPWDRMTIAGAEVLGLVQVTGSLTRKIDARKAPEKDGAQLASLGNEPARFEVSVTLWTSAQLERWDLITLVLRTPNESGKPTAFDVNHPALAMLGITKAVPERISFPQRRDKGIYEARVSFVEWRTPRDASKSESPVVSSSKAGFIRGTVLGPAPDADRTSKDPARDATATGP